MEKVAIFEKVSINQFCKDRFGYPYDESCVDTKGEYDALKLPKRKTKGSAGYDFSSPFNFMLNSGDSIVIPTGIRVRINDGWVLKCYPRSGLGTKYDVMIANTVGIIDADYYYSDNEGHIMIKLKNNGTKNLEINIGDSFAQGIFVPFGITYDDDACGVRNGGFGSTGR